MSVLPCKARDSVFIKGDTVWDVLSQAMKFFYEADITPQEFMDADSEHGEDEREEHLYSSYVVDGDGEVWHNGGWLLPIETSIKGLWEVHKI